MLTTIYNFIVVTLIIHDVFSTTYATTHILQYYDASQTFALRLGTIKKQPGPDKRGEKQPEAARNSQKQPGAARSIFFVHTETERTAQRFDSKNQKP